MRRQQNRNDRTGSSQDFSNNEGFHNYQDYSDRSFRNSPRFNDRNRSNYDDGMARSERNDYRTDSEYRFDDDHRSPFRSGSSQRSEWNRPGQSAGQSSWEQPESRYQTRYGAGSPYRQGRQDYRSDLNRGDDRSDEHAGYQGTQSWQRPTQQNADRYESDYGSASQYGTGTSYGSQSPYGYGSSTGTGSTYGQSQNQNWSSSPSYGRSSFANDDMSSYGADWSRRSQGSQFDSSYGRGSAFQSQQGQQNQQGQRAQGQHAGKAPKGYRRADERIREDVCEALRQNSEIDASEIEVDVKDGMVTLTGSVESRQIKRLAEDEIESVSGVSDVKNELRVVASSDSFGKSKSGSSWEKSSDEQSDSSRQTGSTSGSKSNLGRSSSPSATSTSSSKSVQ